MTILSKLAQAAQELLKLKDIKIHIEQCRAVDMEPDADKVAYYIEHRDEAWRRLRELIALEEARSKQGMSDTEIEDMVSSKDMGVVPVDRDGDVDVWQVRVDAIRYARDQGYLPAVPNRVVEADTFTREEVVSILVDMRDWIDCDDEKEGEEWKRRAALYGIDLPYTRKLHGKELERVYEPAEARKAACLAALSNTPSNGK